ncbi:MAG TPA: transposase [Thermodesulfobacteriota bacterium]|nr:transposase [Thermodesulfobacteriota bacterium]
MKRKRWTAEEKLAFIQEAESEGVVATCRRYGIYASAYYQWKRRYDAMGIEGLSSRKSRDPEFERLMRENQRLKQLLADKELELSIKESLLKKTLQRKKREG